MNALVYVLTGTRFDGRNKSQIAPISIDADTQSSSLEKWTTLSSDDEHSVGNK